MVDLNPFDPVALKSKTAQKVVEEYVSASRRYQVPIVQLLGGAGAMLAAGALVVSGGAAWMLIAGLAVGGFMAAKSGYSKLSPKTIGEHKNKAGQHYMSHKNVELALKGMEKRLANAFKQAKKRKPGWRDELKHTIDDIRTDERNLSRAFRMVSGGPKGFGTDEFIFIVEERYVGPGELKRLTPEEKYEELLEKFRPRPKQEPAEPTQEQQAAAAAKPEKPQKQKPKKPLNIQPLGR